MSNVVARETIAKVPSDGVISATLELRNLTKSFGENVVVRDVGFRIEAGTFLTLLGPSGSGKTTTLRMIAGFEAPTTGSVYVGGKDITHKSPHTRDIGVVFQQFALFPHMTVFKNIAYPLEMRRCPKKDIACRVKAALDLVGLKDYSTRYPKQLSGGQQQRVALARAVVFNPRVMLMDEPLSSLDRRLRESMQVEIKHLQKRLGITTIAVTHDQVEAIIMSDIIAIMDRGVLQQIGPPLEIYRKPANKFVAEFIGESNLLNGVIRRTSAGEAEFITENGLEVVVAQPSSPGESSLLIRPEFVRLLPPSASVRNKYPAQILEILSLGDLVKYRVRARSGDEICAKTLISLADPRWVVGQKVTIGWEATDCLLLNPTTRSHKHDHH
jgi:putative spermidine/putrescine transport system ATP-binding protein